MPKIQPTDLCRYKLVFLSLNIHYQGTQRLDGKTYSRQDYSF